MRPSRNSGRQTHQANLEDVFRQLTHKQGSTPDSDMSGIIEKLRS